MGPYCSIACTAAANKVPDNSYKSRYRFTLRGDHPLADADGKVPLHRLVLYEQIGSGPHPCHWCGTEVEWAPGERTAPGALVVDHIDNDGINNDPGNLVPSCHRCNSLRHRTDLVGDDELYVLDKRGNRHRAVPRTCKQCGKDFPHLAADKRPNRGQFCSRSCARMSPRRRRA